MTSPSTRAYAMFQAWAALAVAMPTLAANDAADANGSGLEASERVPVQTVIPEYPEKAREERLEGEVQVCFLVDRDGRPYRIAVRKSTHRIFERGSVRAVRASRYAPLAPGENHPKIKSCRTFRYSLESVKDL